MWSLQRSSIAPAVVSVVVQRHAVGLASLRRLGNSDPKYKPQQPTLIRWAFFLAFIPKDLHINA
jgi:hypothetical protein